ncbi:MAG: TlpA disulfide reductase family protein [Bryobacteraceae bacterium]
MQRRRQWLTVGLFSLVLPLLGAEVGRPTPEYAIKLTDGKQLLLSSYRGKVVALLFVSTDCPHCMETCRVMEGLQKQYGPKGFQTLAVAFNPMAMMLAPEFAKTAGATFPVGYDERDPVFSYLQRSPTLRTYVPIMVFIDRKGIVRGQFLGDDQFFTNRDNNIRSMLDKLTAEPATPPKKK